MYQSGQPRISYPPSQPQPAQHANPSCLWMLMGGLCLLSILTLIASAGVFFYFNTQTKHQFATVEAQYQTAMAEAAFAKTEAVAIRDTVQAEMANWQLSGVNPPPTSPPEEPPPTPGIASSTPQATATPPVTSVTLTVKTMVVKPDEMILVYVPAGEFEMGAVEVAGPVHKVYLDAFWIDRTEVTNGMFALCVAAGGCQPPQADAAYSISDYYSNPQYASYPVTNVSWFQAEAYCQWAGRQLPTEAQWEKAARGTDGRIYPWGNEFDGTKLNFCDKNCLADYKDDAWDDGYLDFAPVGSYPQGASPYGALDMGGNVLEWVRDWYGGDYYSNSPSSNPTGPASGELRVLRGGSYFDIAQSSQSAVRVRDNPDKWMYTIGFRCALPEVP